jgi:hypothetical protein
MENKQTKKPVIKLSVVQYDGRVWRNFYVYPEELDKGLRWLAHQFPQCSIKIGR